MKIEVCLFATLGSYLPKSAAGDSAVLDVPESTTVGDVLQSLGIPADFERLQVVNGVDAPDDHVLRDGDVLSAFPPLSGGGKALGKRQHPLEDHER